MYVVFVVAVNSKVFVPLPAAVGKYVVANELVELSPPTNSVNAWKPTPEYPDKAVYASGIVYEVETLYFIPGIVGTG